MPHLQDHPLRFTLANELHARPSPVISAPGRVVFLAIKQPTDAAARDRGQDVAHLCALLDRHGAAHPKPDATHHSARIGRHILKWEQHTEFITYTAFCEGLGDRPFDPAEFEVFPADWLKNAPGQCITSAMVHVSSGQKDADIATALDDLFVSDSLAAARTLDNSAIVASDFRIDPAGNMRFAVFALPETGQRRIGRIVQRLCEIETYKAMSMLGFARARAMSAQVGELDTRLSDLMTGMTGGAIAAEQLLSPLLSVSAELETIAAQSSFRFGATAAYEALVHQKIESLREDRFMARQTFREFMARRYVPAMRTVKATERRLGSLADRAMRTGDLLRTRVDVERSAQNQALLKSMDRRADLQLRLQHTVEGLSVVAISYYAVSLVSYLLYPLTGAAGISKGMLSALVTLPVVLFVWLMIRRIRRKIE